MRKILLIIAMLMSLFLTTSLLAAPVNINQATAEQLAENLNGIGIKKAQAIGEIEASVMSAFSNLVVPFKWRSSHGRPSQPR